MVTEQIKMNNVANVIVRPGYPNFLIIFFRSDLRNMIFMTYGVSWRPVMLVCLDLILITINSQTDGNALLSSLLKLVCFFISIIPETSLDRGLSFSGCWYACNIFYHHINLFRSKFFQYDSVCHMVVFHQIHLSNRDVISKIALDKRRLSHDWCDQSKPDKNIATDEGHDRIAWKKNTLKSADGTIGFASINQESGGPGT